MLKHHHAYWILHCNEGRGSQRGSILIRNFDSSYVWKENIFFLQQMGHKVIQQLTECGLDRREFSVSLSMNRDNFSKQCFQAHEFFAGKGVMRLNDVIDQSALREL